MSEQITTGLLERDATEGLTMSGTLSDTGSATSERSDTTVTWLVSSNQISTISTTNH